MYYKCISITYVLGTSPDGVGCNLEVVSAGILSEINNYIYFHILL